MPESVLQLDSRDNVLVALVALTIGTTVQNGGTICEVTENIPAKHKLALTDLAPGDVVRMYGMIVGEVEELRWS
jgi:altronate hydrolase